NKYKIRELGPPRGTEFGPDKKSLRCPRNPIQIPEDDLDLGPKLRVGHTAYAAQVRAYRNIPIGALTRRLGNLFLFRKDKSGKQAPETNEEVLAHLFEFAFRPVVIWEHPVDTAGNIVSSSVLKARIDAGSKDWDEGIVFPHYSCEVAWVLFTDLAAPEMMRRFREESGIGIVFLGAALGPDNLETLQEVW